MSVILHMNIPASLCHAPRVDNSSLVLEAGPAGEAARATVNPAAMTTNEVVLWDLPTKRFKTTGVSAIEIGYLDGVIPGQVTASKVLVVDANRDLAAATGVRIRNLIIDGTFSVYGALTAYSTIATSGGGGITSSGALSAGTDLSVAGLVQTNLTLASGFFLRGFAGGYYRNLISLHPTNTRIYIGGAANDLYIESPNVFIGAGRVWHADNDGVGSGLDADLLDGQQGAYYAAPLQAFTRGTSHFTMHTGLGPSFPVVTGTSTTWNYLKFGKSYIINCQMSVTMPAAGSTNYIAVALGVSHGSPSFLASCYSAVNVYDVTGASHKPAQLGVDANGLVITLNTGNFTNNNSIIISFGCVLPLN